MHSHEPEQIDRLVKLIEYQGMRNPVIVQKGTNLIVAGHGRLMALKKMGAEKVPVIYQEFDSEAQLYAYMVSDNAIGKDTWATLDLGAINTEMLDLGPDFDIDMLGIKDFVIEPIEKFEPQADEDAAPEVVHPITRKGDLWILGKHRLLCGDSTMIDDVEKLMGDEKADMVFTDPPYGIGLDKAGQKLGKSQAYGAVLNDHNSEVAIDAFNLCASLGIDKLFFWGANHYSEALPSSPCWLVWDKQGGKSVTYADCELCYTNLKSPVRMFTHIWDGFRRDSEKGQKRVHPTQKPVKLFEDIFAEYNLPQNVLDLFLGSGSTLIACEKTNRKCYGMELDEKYCDVIIKRWEQYTGRKATLESTGQTYEELKVERDGEAK
jgi:DNA modification methylase